MFCKEANLESVSLFSLKKRLSNLNNVQEEKAKEGLQSSKGT